MSLVIAAPEVMADAAAGLANISSTLDAAHMAAATPTVAVVPAAADEVSASIAHLFSQHAQDYQALAGRAAAFHEQFVQHLTSSAAAYASAENANATLLGLAGCGRGLDWGRYCRLREPIGRFVQRHLEPIAGSVSNSGGSSTRRARTYCTVAQRYWYITARSAVWPYFYLEGSKSAVQ